MRKFLLAAAGFAAITGAAGLALAQDDGPQRGHRGVFQSDSNSDGVLTLAATPCSRVSTPTIAAKSPAKKCGLSAARVVIADVAAACIV